ncbi:hypothetical protein Ahy_A07g035932 [Arachis hypogaea]|uniref:Amidase domain-containing protein n=1 Tax=Arachis hypogaea TaxID=3818 RepID=A0A445CER1_ARAHY|nr:hypothetical protein Ahy_A07g035932 [Arachis hypogaea]
MQPQLLLLFLTLFITHPQANQTQTQVKPIAALKSKKEREKWADGKGEKGEGGRCPIYATVALAAPCRQCHVAVLPPQSDASCLRHHSRPSPSQEELALLSNGPEPPEPSPCRHALPLLPCEQRRARDLDRRGEERSHHWGPGRRCQRRGGRESSRASSCVATAPCLTAVDLSAVHCRRMSEKRCRLGFCHYTTPFLPLPCPVEVVRASAIIGVAVQLMPLLGSLRYEPPLTELLCLVVSASFDTEFQFADMPSTSGSRILEGYLSLFNATAVKRAKELGAIVVGNTNQDEFGMGSTTEGSAFQLRKLQLELGGKNGILKAMKLEWTAKEKTEKLHESIENEVK